MKALIQFILQKILGFKRYLWIFTLYKLRVLKKDKSEADFFHFVDILDKNDTVLDIGANLGLMSYYLSKKCKQVHAFEPIPQNLNNLYKLKRFKNLDNLVIHPIALGNHDGDIELVLPVVSGVKKQGLSHVKDEKMEIFNSGESYKCPIARLDNIELAKDLSITGIKMDVENYEYEVLLGAKQLLLSHKPLVYTELWDNQNRLDCFEFMTSLGYRIKVLKDDQLVSYQSDKSHTQNFFFIYESS